MDIAKIESAIELTLSKKYPAISQNRKGLALCARELSDLFTKERSSISENYFKSANYRAAYLAHFTLINYVKATLCLNEISLPKIDRPVRILDIGCGTGAGLAAMALAFPKIKLNMVGLDSSADILDDASEFLSKIASEIHEFKLINKTFSHEADSGIALDEKFDIIIAANVLNEFQNDETPNFIRNLIDKNLTDGGHVVIIEPALKETSRRLMITRDELIQSSGCKIIAPCLHQKNCPMLAANDRDWCHFYADWNKSDLSKQMDSLVGTDRKYLKYSYLIIQKSFDICKGDDDRIHRIVSSPLKSKGKLELILCGCDGILRKMRRLDKDRSDQNSDMDDVKRGDVVRCDAVEKISKTTAFRLAHKF